MLLDQYDTNGQDELGFNQFAVSLFIVCIVFNLTSFSLSVRNFSPNFQEIMEELEGAGWKKAKNKKAKEINSMDLRAIFNLVDVDRSGSVSRTVSIV